MHDFWPLGSQDPGQCTSRYPLRQQRPFPYTTRFAIVGQNDTLIPPHQFRVATMNSLPLSIFDFNIVIL